MMMKNDAMMKNGSTSMSANSMMKSTRLSSMTVTAVAMHFGYKWRTDRAKLAKMVGISNYRGTYSQNMMIKAYLIKNNGRIAMRKNPRVVGLSKRNWLRTYHSLY